MGPRTASSCPPTICRHVASSPCVGRDFAARASGLWRSAARAREEREEAGGEVSSKEFSNPLLRGVRYL